MVTLVPMAGGREFGANTDTCPPYRTACAAEWYHRYSVCELQLSCGRHHSARLSCQRKATILGQKQNMRNIRKGICELFLTTRKNLKPFVAKSDGGRRCLHNVNGGHIISRIWEHFAFMLYRAPTKEGRKTHRREDDLEKMASLLLRAQRNATNVITVTPGVDPVSVLRIPVISVCGVFVQTDVN